MPRGLIYALLCAALLVGPAHAARPARCPEAFADFWAVFRRDVAFQRAHTAQRLLESHVDNCAGAECPISRTKTVRTAKIVGPIVWDWPGAEQRLLSKGSRATAALYTPDTDAVVEYTFIKKDKCWELSHRDDGSL